LGDNVFKNERFISMLHGPEDRRAMPPRNALESAAHLKRRA
jgi:hypothetical protein